MAAHEFKSLIVTGHEDKDIIVTDFKTKQQVVKLEFEVDAMPNSLLFVNNGLTLLVGFADGSVAASSYGAAECCSSGGQRQRLRK